MLDSISLPNATTWTCMVLVLIVMIFVRFARPFQWRHWDLLLLFLITLPLLLLRTAQEERDDAIKYYLDPATNVSPRIASLICMHCSPTRQPFPVLSEIAVIEQCGIPGMYKLKPFRFDHPGIWRSYLWLMAVTALLLFRSLVDLGLERRNEYRSNLTTGGMIWLASVMLIVMILKAFLPEWRGIPQPQNPSYSVTFLSSILPSQLILNILTLLSQAIIVLNLFLIGWMHFKNVSMGAAVSLLYLLMPYTAMMAMNTSQAFASLFIVLAVTWYRFPMLAGLFLGIGTILSFFPASLVPAWAGFYYRRGHGRFLVSYFTVMGVIILILMIYTGFIESLSNVWSLAEWQAWKFALKPTADGLWNTVSLHVAYRIPLFIAFIALVITSAFWPHPKNLGQLISWSAVLILGVQFWYADAGGTYVLWYLPLLVLQTVRPSLTEARPSKINKETDRLTQVISRINPWRKTKLASVHDTSSTKTLAG